MSLPSLLHVPHHPSACVPAPSPCLHPTPHTPALSHAMPCAPLTHSLVPADTTQPPSCTHPVPHSAPAPLPCTPHPCLHPCPQRGHLQNSTSSSPCSLRARAKLCSWSTRTPSSSPSSSESASSSSSTTTSPSSASPPNTRHSQVSASSQTSRVPQPCMVPKPVPRGKDTDKGPRAGGAGPLVLVALRYWLPGTTDKAAGPGGCFPATCPHSRTCTASGTEAMGAQTHQ